MREDIASRWADALEQTPKELQGFLSLRYRDDTGIKMCALGVLADVVIKMNPSFQWIPKPNTSACAWIVAPLVVKGHQDLLDDTLPHELYEFVEAVTSPLTFNNGGMTVEALNDTGMSFQYMARLVRKYGHKM